MHTDTYLAAGMRAVGAGSSGAYVASTAVTVPTHTEAGRLVLAKYHLVGLCCSHLPGLNFHAKARGNG